MPEITVISGKGGTGKTSVAAAFARLATNHIVCDLDVDAPDLHLLLRPEILETHDFQAGRMAKIDAKACLLCGECRDRCRFGAIVTSDTGFAVDQTACEGCGVCEHFCPAGAITMERHLSGYWFRSRTEDAPMIHAQLLPGAESSGLLVSVLRRAARAESERTGRGLIIADGPPGIGCPVISAIAGTDAAVLVTEPTPSGMHDLERAADLCAHFGRPAGIIVNKADINEERSRDIEKFCASRGLPLLARIPYDPAVVDALMAGLTMADLGSHRITTAIRAAWKNVLAAAKGNPAAAPIAS